MSSPVISLLSLHRHRARASIRKHRHRGKTSHQTIQLQESKLNNRPGCNVLTEKHLMKYSKGKVSHLI